MKLLAALALFLAASIAQPQQAAQRVSPGDSRLDVLLERLYAYADQYRATLPSLSCDERVDSRQVSYDGKVRKVRVEGTMRVLRKTPPVPFDPFSEQHTFTKVNRRSIGSSSVGELDLPYFIQGIFANLIGFHYVELKDCFNFHVTALNYGAAGQNEVQVEVDRMAEPPQTACRAILAGTHYMVIADAATGRIRHSERTIPAEAAEQRDEAYFAAIDYAPQKFGDRIFWLPAKSSAHDDTGTGRMEAVYSNCHRYAGEMRIIPDAAVEVAQPGKP